MNYKTIDLKLNRCLICECICVYGSKNLSLNPKNIEMDNLKPKQIYFSFLSFPYTYRIKEMSELMQTVQQLGPGTCRNVGTQSDQDAQIWSA